MRSAREPKKNLRRSVSSLILILAIVGQSTLYAQSPSIIGTAGAVAASDSTELDGSVRLLVGRSSLVNVGKPITRVSLTSADVADVLVTSSNQLLVNGKVPGTISMFVWDRGGTISRYEVIVQRDLARLSEQLHRLFPNEPIEVQSTGKAVVLAGAVSSKEVIDKAVSIAAGYVDTKDQVVPLLQVEGPGTSQVLLRVRFAEVSRSVLTEAGLSLFTGATGYKNYLARSSTEQYPAPVFDNSDPNRPKLLFEDFLNLFVFNTKEQLGAVLKALQNQGLFQSLAEPNLVAESGKEASFLAGGEFPIPVAQGSGSNVAVTVVFKEFGIRLSFTPTVNGDRIHLKVRPEVSTLDFNNAVTLQGFRIPALATRRTETELELMDHQTFAISGLLDNRMNSTLQKIPGIGDIPILGLLFKSKAAQKNQTELVVMITPEILPRNSPGVTSQLPRLNETYMPPMPAKKQIEPPPPAFMNRPGGSTTAAPAAQPADGRDPAAAAAKLQSLMPSTRSANDPASAAGPGATANAPAGQPAANVDAQPATQSRPMTSDEKKALERALKQKAEDDRRRQQAEAAAAVKQAEIDKRNQELAAAAAAKKAEEDKRLAEELQKQQEKAAREQAKRDAEAAKKAQEEARRQAEVDQKRQKAIEEAAARLKAAEAQYQAELSRGSAR